MTVRAERGAGILPYRAQALWAATGSTKHSGAAKAAPK